MLVWSKLKMASKHRAWPRSPTPQSPSHPPLSTGFVCTGSTGGKPTSSGLSLQANSTKAPTTTPMMPGAHMPHCQPIDFANPPATMGARKPPRLCAMFHMPQYVPLSLEAHQLVRMRAQQGPPTPWKKLKRQCMNDCNAQWKPTGKDARAAQPADTLARMQSSYTL